MKLSHETSKIHKWLQSLPLWVYVPLMLLYLVCLGIAIFYALCSAPVFANRLFWIADVLVLSTFFASHLVYRWRSRDRPFSEQRWQQ